MYHQDPPHSDASIAYLWKPCPYYRLAGFLRGVGKGFAGVVAAPVVAGLGAFSRVTEGVDATVRTYWLGIRLCHGSS